MQSLGEKKEYNRVVQGTCIKSNVAYLILHIIYLILFIIGFFTGGIFGVLLMCMIQINRDKEENK